MREASLRLVRLTLALRRWGCASDEPSRLLPDPIEREREREGLEDEDEGAENSFDKSKLHGKGGPDQAASIGEGEPTGCLFLFYLFFEVIGM